MLSSPLKSMMVGKEDLGLSLSFPQKDHRPLTHPHPHPLQLNLMPALVHPPISSSFTTTLHKPSWNDAFPSSDQTSNTCRGGETRSAQFYCSPSNQEEPLHEASKRTVECDVDILGS